MTIVKKGDQARLRFGPGVSGFNGRTGSGVALFSEIPIGATVTAVVDRPSELIEVSLGGQGAATPSLAPYKFESAALPASFIAGTGGPEERTLKRVLVPDGGNGKFIPYQVVPAFATIGGGVTGSLAQKGRKEHSFATPATPKDRHIVRLRWTGTTATNENQNARLTDPLTGAASWTPNAVRTKFKGRLLNVNIVPGSVVMVVTANSVSVTLRDAGDGRFVGLHADSDGNVDCVGDGVIDYLTGEFLVTFYLDAPDNATNMLVSYEHGCKYYPLDADVEYDCLLQ